MDCSLSTWPSFTQFDDLTWMGLGDIDPLESLDRSFDNDSQYTETSFSNPGKPVSPAAKTSLSHTSPQLVHTKSDDFYRLTSAESLVATRWESINVVDLASVLDNFPSNKDSPTPGDEDVYDLYSESIVMQGEPPLSGDVDMFMSDSMSEMADVNNTVLTSDDKSPMNDATVISSDHSSLSSTQEDTKCEVSVVDDDSPPASVNVSGSLSGSFLQKDMENPGRVRGDCYAQHVNYVENRRGGSRTNMVQPSGCFALDPMNLHGCANAMPSSHGALNLKQSIAPQQHACIQPGMMIHRSNPQPTSGTAQLYDREQVVQHSPMHIGENYPAIFDQQVRMVDAARVTSELKRNRAQANRARRLAASQRRAKKYPLQKLIRMSSSPASTRDKLDQNLSGVMPHQPLQPVSQSHANTSTSNSQAPTFMPVVLQGPSTHLASSHELLSHANCMHGAPYYGYQHPSTVHHEDKLTPSSGCNSFQPRHSDQDAQSLSAIPSSAARNATNSTQSLDVVLLNQLQSIVNKMNVDMRLCIRDALYRLARSSKYRQSRAENLSGSDVNSSHLEAMETNTNSIDRWIVNMLFCKQPAPFEAHSQPYFLHASSNVMDNANIDSNMQQWNSCGSPLSLQDQPLHVLTEVLPSDGIADERLIWVSCKERA
ncbi:hypothetical protein GOP47_0002511 [Adiantum capillus-veneris]|uniref:Uncharacterized protein n=1 Tax=Adiantum capillus-veneris TaxID=13818 RepID=A0A9D4VAR3_ADICA|nr:hypothetical protein GOP47_0002511 [Adiantum capillus-veneris]